MHLSICWAGKQFLVEITQREVENLNVVSRQVHGAMFNTNYS